MSFVHRILYAIRALAEEEPKQNRRKRRRRPRSTRAVALVITFHDLFSSKGISHLLENPRRIPPDFPLDLTFPSDTKPSEAWFRETPPLEASPLNELVALSPDTKKKSKEAWFKEEPPLETSQLNAEVAVPTDTKVKSSEVWFKMTPPLGTERVLASSDASLLNAVVAVPPDLRLTPSEAWLLRSPPFGDALQKSQCVDDRQRAVVENAVNRVREEQLKKKRKLKFFRLKFC